MVQGQPRCQQRAKQRRAFDTADLKTALRNIEHITTIPLLLSVLQQGGKIHARMLVQTKRSAAEHFQGGHSILSGILRPEAHINSRSAACFPDAGPIPPGQYYIFDRQSGGRLGALRDAFGGRDDWFALHTIDDKIDDETLCDQIKRGAFRLHPKGMYGISKGCIVIERKADFDHLRAHLKSMKPQPVKGSGLLAYGRVVVK